MVQNYIITPEKLHLAQALSQKERNKQLGTIKGSLKCSKGGAASIKQETKHYRILKTDKRKGKPRASQLMKSYQTHSC